MIDAADEVTLEDISHDTWGSEALLLGALLSMTHDRRIALAAELLPAGYVVARDVGERDALEYVPGANSAESYACGYVAGHNACRAAMMREGDAE
jgi:hypothetical protein